MKTRIIQLASRYIGVCLISFATLVLGDVNPDTQEAISDLATGLATAVASILFFAVDLAIHRLGSGAIMTPPGERK